MRIGLSLDKHGLVEQIIENVILVFVWLLAISIHTTIRYQILDTGSLTCLAQTDLNEISMIFTNIKTAL